MPGLFNGACLHIWAIGWRLPLELWRSMCCSCAPAPIVVEGRTNNTSPHSSTCRCCCCARCSRSRRPLLSWFHWDPLSPLRLRCSWRPTPAERVRQRLLCGQLDPILTVVALVQQGTGLLCAVLTVSQVPAQLPPVQQASVPPGCCGGPHRNPDHTHWLRVWTFTFAGHLPAG